MTLDHLLSQVAALAFDGVAIGADVVAFVLLVALTFVPLEWAFSDDGADAPERRPDWQTDLAFAVVGGVLVRLMLLPVAAGLLWLGGSVGFDAAPWRFVTPPAVAVSLDLGIGLLLFELAGYAYHRAAHAIPALWRLHAVHHSSERLDWLASFRQHPVELVLLTLAQNLPLVLLGIPLATHVLLLVALRLHTVFVHAALPVPSGWWSRILAMPAFHHRHHAATLRPANFASLFPWIDACFGTHEEPTAARSGVDEPLPRRFVSLLLWPLSSTHSAARREQGLLRSVEPTKAEGVPQRAAAIRSRSSRTRAAA